MGVMMRCSYMPGISGSEQDVVSGQVSPQRRKFPPRPGSRRRMHAEGFLETLDGLSAILEWLQGRGRAHSASDQLFATSPCFPLLTVLHVPCARTPHPLCRWDEDAHQGLGVLYKYEPAWKCGHDWRQVQVRRHSAPQYCQPDCVQDWERNLRQRNSSLGQQQDGTARWLDRLDGRQDHGGRRSQFNLPVDCKSWLRIHVYHFVAP